MSTSGVSEGTVTSPEAEKGEGTKEKIIIIREKKEDRNTLFGIVFVVLALGFFGLDVGITVYMFLMRKEENQKHYPSEAIPIIMMVLHLLCATALILFAVIGVWKRSKNLILNYIIIAGLFTVIDLIFVCLYFHYLRVILTAAEFCMTIIAIFYYFYM